MGTMFVEVVHIPSQVSFVVFFRFIARVRSVNVLLQVFFYSVQIFFLVVPAFTRRDCLFNRFCLASRSGNVISKNARSQTHRIQTSNTTEQPQHTHCHHAQTRHFSTKTPNTRLPTKQPTDHHKYVLHIRFSHPLPPNRPLRLRRPHRRLQLLHPRHML
jgi:hypothetical protein